MYTLALILGTTLTQVGSYATLKECNTEVLNLRAQEVKAVCVKQPSPEEMAKQMAPFLQAMQKMLDQ
jgi:hypothetical protein